MTDEQVEAAITRIGQLPANWAKPNAPAFNTATLNRVRTLATRLRQRGFNINNVSPVDGIAFYLRFDERFVVSVESQRGGTIIVTALDRFKSANEAITTFTITPQNEDDSYATVQNLLNKNVEEP